MGKIIVFAGLSLMASAVCASASTDIVTVANFRVAAMICLCGLSRRLCPRRSFFDHLNSRLFQKFGIT